METTGELVQNSTGSSLELGFLYLSRKPVMEVTDVPCGEPQGSVLDVSSLISTVRTFPEPETKGSDQRNSSRLYFLFSSFESSRVLDPTVQNPAGLQHFEMFYNYEPDG